MRHGEEEVKTVIYKIFARFGHLYIAVNNARAVGIPGSAADVTPAGYQGIFDTNVLGVLLAWSMRVGPPSATPTLGSSGERPRKSPLHEVSRSRCPACQADLFSLFGVSLVGLNESANPLCRHGFRKQMSLG